jgi:predicted ATP-dependent endonuclease of OLD family
MKLMWVTLNGYRRFAEEIKVNLDGKVIAFVGTNESGKSSFLKALQHLNNLDAFVRTGSGQELTRGATIQDNQAIIGAGFLLDDSDRKAVAHIPEGDKIRWLTIQKTTVGRPFFASTFPPLVRYITSRVAAAQKLSEVLQSGDLSDTQLATIKRGKSSLSSKDIRDLLEQLNSKAGTLPSETIATARLLAEGLKSIILTSSSVSLENLFELLTQMITYEETEHPNVTARNILFSRRPTFLLFSDDARLLQSEYALDTIGDNPPAALRNLLRIARLELETLIRLMNEKDYGQVETFIERANERLKAFFQEVWSQSNVTVRLRVDGTVMRVLVGNAETSYVDIAERSDGLRQFVALLAFTTLEQSENIPILLIDEAETHLHYDAQADMVQMFAKQEVVSQVIYTTHSIGCLPEDLGAGIRMVEGLSSGKSMIHNWFWESNRPGFSPLLFGMGAGTLAFIPVRFSLFTEGASDLILLPTLLREATKRSVLGFQVVPGLSSISEAAIGLLENESPRTAYLVDADKGGGEIRKKLVRAGIQPERIFHLPDLTAEGMVLEDFVKPEVYIAAVNEEFRRSYDSTIAFPETNLPLTDRPKAVENWCKSLNIKPPNKRAVAYRILEFKNEDPDQALLIEQYVVPMQQLYQNIVTALNLKI